MAKLSPVRSVTVMKRVPSGARPTASTASAQNRLSRHRRRFCLRISGGRRHTHLPALMQHAQQPPIGEHRQRRVLKKALSLVTPDRARPFLAAYPVKSMSLVSCTHSTTG